MFFRSRFRITNCAITILFASWTGSSAADWQATLSKEPAGNFPELRPLRASYRFGWSGVTAASGEVHFTKPSNDRFQLEGTGRTIGFVRALWKLDVTYRSLFDLHSAALYLRSQPLKQGSVYRLVVYAATNAYLATVTVTGREKSSVRAGTYNAIKLDLRLKRIGKHLELEPHKKFRGATIWVSDDAERLILRIDAQVYVGTVFAELQSVRFDNLNQR